MTAQTAEGTDMAKAVSLPFMGTAKLTDTLAAAPAAPAASPASIAWPTPGRAATRHPPRSSTPGRRQLFLTRCSAGSAWSVIEWERARRGNLWDDVNLTL